MLYRDKNRDKNTKIVIYILAAVLLIRILLLVQYTSQSPLSKIPMIDAAIHHDTAVKIAQGKIIQDKPFDRPPLYSYFLSSLFVIIGPNLIIIYIIQIILCLIGLLLLFKICKHYTDHASSLLAITLCSFYGPLAFFELKILPASLSVFLVLLYVYLTIVYLKRRSIWWALFVGVVGGLLVLDRPNLIFIPLLTILWLFLRHSYRSILSHSMLIVGFLVSLSPCVVHNLIAGDCTAIICTGGGLNFYLGNRKEAEVSFTYGYAGFTDPSTMQMVSARTYIEEIGNEYFNNADLERYWLSKGFNEIYSNPLSWLILIFSKLKALVSEYEYGVNYSYEAENDILFILRLYFVPFSLLVSLGIINIFIKQNSINNLSRAPLYIVLISVILSTIIFFTYSRFRIVAVPILSILSAETIYYIKTIIKKKQKGKIIRLLIPVILLVIVSLLPPGNLANRQISGGYALLGAAYARNNNMNNAIKAYDEALNYNPTSIKALQTQASLYVMNGNYSKARDNHLKAINLGKNDPSILTNASMFFLNVPPPYRNINKAIELAIEAKNIDIDYPLSYICLGIANGLKGRSQESINYFNTGINKSNNNPLLIKIISDWYRSRGLKNKAKDLEKLNVK